MIIGHIEDCQNDRKRAMLLTAQKYILRMPQKLNRSQNSLQMMKATDFGYFSFCKEKFVNEKLLRIRTHQSEKQKRKTKTKTCLS